MLPCDKTTSHLRTIHFFEGSSITPIRCTEFCISRSVAVTLFTFGGQVYKRWRENHSGFCRGAATFSKLGVQCLGVGYCTEQNTDGIPSFVHCSLLRNGSLITLFIKKSWGGPSKFWGSGSPHWGWTLGILHKQYSNRLIFGWFTKNVMWTFLRHGVDCGRCLDAHSSLPIRYDTDNSQRWIAIVLFQLCDTVVYLRLWTGYTVHVYTRQTVQRAPLCPVRR